MLADVVRATVVRRYPVAVIDTSSTSVEGAQKLVEEAKELPLAVVDVRGELLSEEGGGLLGAITRRELVDWMKHRATELGGALVVNPDEVIGSWSETEQERFFKDLMQQELPLTGSTGARVPLILGSARADRLSPQWVEAKRDGCGITARY